MEGVLSLFIISHTNLTNISSILFGCIQDTKSSAEVSLISKNDPKHFLHLHTVEVLYKNLPFGDM